MRLKGRITTVAIYLGLSALAGAATTLCTAWSIAYFSHRPEETDSDGGAALDDTGRWVLWHTTSSRGITIIRCELAYEPELIDRRLNSTRSGCFGGGRVTTDVRDIPGGLHLTMPQQPRAVFGWPRPCMWAAWDSRFSAPMFQDFGPVGAIEVDKGECWWEWRSQHRLLPAVPIVSQFAINTAAATSAWLGVLLLPTVARKGIRRRRGRCLSCGYDRAGLPLNAPCPECGAVP
jgi:hypothetical protein